MGYYNTTIQLRNKFHAFRWILNLFMFIRFVFLFNRDTAELIIRRARVGKPVNEMYIISIFVGVLVMAALSDAIGLYFFIGPILFGLVMPNGPPLATTITEKSELIIQEFLMPFFYLYIGINTNLYRIRNHWKVAITFQGILFAGFFTKVVACVLVSPTYDIRLKHGLVLGLIY